MSSLKLRFAQLRPEIDRVTSHALDDALSSFEAPQAGHHFYAAAHTAITGGKRLRALLAQLGASIAQKQPLTAAPVLDLGAALELYQASALVHDDIIDHAPTRRGVPTTHVHFANQHGDRRWIGDSDEYGRAVAILAGDLLFSAAELAICRQGSQLPSQRALALMSAYSKMHAEVAYGQFLDVAGEQIPLDPLNDAAVDAQKAQQVVLHKSARYSIVHPMLLGATAGGAQSDLLAALEKALTPWGIAFQLRDDELGVFGDPQITGKPAGDDIREGKRTVLLALTWAYATPGEREALSKIIGRSHLTEGDVARARSIIDERGRRRHEEMITELVESGEQALQDPIFNAYDNSDLAELAQIVVHRQS
ncbi:polyprenyl synthetase family protein [Schaalia vaccimaxillae]|uniref:polyprenyl synthetase family protein n=1 Tax=Schaalia vaccimaxillae TaxID=183916 RepID=UPI0003B390A7|nr:polyprenyl synthetase family protein [Schaalia vaccimaxillae]